MIPARISILVYQESEPRMRGDDPVAAGAISKIPV